MKAPTEEFPFDYDVPRRSRKILRSNTDDRAKNIRVEVGRTSSRSPSPETPASDVVKIRVYRRDGNATQIRQKGVKTEEVRLRNGDVVVRDTRAEASMTQNIEPTPGWGYTSESQW